ncbi:hypothetical protein DFH28DRAFT_439765 [Melampsora americana]|nr:hypothetical protein DFH28DRAFT_439765 [Melampsora americana]
MKIELRTLGLCLSLPVAVLAMEHPQSTLELMRNPLSGQDLVNIYSFQPQPLVSSWDSPVYDIISPSPLSSIAKSTPISIYFSTAQSVQFQSENVKIKLLANEVLNLIDTLGPGLETWSMWLQRNEDLVTRCFWLAEDALKPLNKYSEGERLWAVGVLAAFVKYLPPNADGITSHRKFKSFDWSAQVWIEVEASRKFESLMTKHFISVWLDNISPQEGHPDLKECLQRADIFGEKMPKILASNVLIPKALLKAQLPVSKGEIESLVKYFAASLKEINKLDGEEGIFSLFIHMLKHSSQFTGVLKEYLQDPYFFRNINVPNAQMQLFDFVWEAKELDLITSHLGERIIDFAKRTASSDLLFQIVDILIKELEEAAKSEDEYFDRIYRTLVSICFIHPSAEYHLRMKYIEKEANVPYFLAKTWFERDEDLTVSSSGDGEFDQLLLMENPSYLQDARRQLSAINMQQSKSKSVQEMGHFLKLLPRVTGKDMALDDTLEKMISDQYAKVLHVLQSTTDTPSAEPIQEMVFEFIFYLKDYKEDWRLLFLDRIDQVEEFKETIMKSAISLIKRNLESWQSKPGSFHIPRSELHGFIKKLVHVYHGHSKEPYSSQMDFKSQKRKSEWLNQDETPVTLLLFEGIPFSINPKRIRRSRPMNPQYKSS